MLNVDGKSPETLQGCVKMMTVAKILAHLACQAMANSVEPGKQEPHKIPCKTLVRIKEQDLLQRAPFRTVSQIIENTLSNSNKETFYH